MKETLVFATARQQFLQHGYAIFSAAIGASLIERLRPALTASTVARARCFIDVPDIESMLKSKSRLSDPLYTKVMARLQRRKYMLRRYREEKKRRKQLKEVVANFLNGREKEDLTGEELWKLSELLAKEAVSVPGKECRSTIKNDPQMLRAINEYRCNVWMTNKELENIVRDPSFWQPIGAIASDVGGVERPVLFADAPMFREPYGGPFGYHCTAPSIGVKTNGNQPLAVSLLVFTHRPDKQKMPLFVLKGSHRFVQDQYLRYVLPNVLSLPFLPMESHIPEQIKRFNFDSSVVGSPIEGGDAIGPGTVVVLNPHLMIGVGANASTERVAVYKLNLIAENAPPFLKAPSWITAWRSLPREVNFASPVVFPPFYDKTMSTTSAR
ncbi:hypothetical protein, conserved [Trypanosoma cruzi]|uniref:Uncharacterized protein n=1 Tax=Trypanosoma cruzi (strain CL Brener) TaxID=353153 RepID=Q4E4Q6_TRYCC|nr:hypothetical protein, conserved [Trypanosoma cruzi]EAN99794.1 hypothetical protein, conserved [Trypanosoma cruzi]|eukprot:XP_821645.1 hypothetical protein [Trypanosoma cruzi strain CL Brener]